MPGSQVSETWINQENTQTNQEQSNFGLEDPPLYNRPQTVTTNLKKPDSSQIVPYNFCAAFNGRVFLARKLRITKRGR